MSTILSSISCNLDTNILLASLPLFEAEKVEAIEWSFDTLYKTPDIPLWFTDLLEAFSNENRLIGHGVFFSLFSGRWSNEQQDWLNHLEKLSSAFQFDHISEHFGFMTGENFHDGAPLSIPFAKRTLAIGQDRLKRIFNSCKCPVGLENLAFSYSLEEVKNHGEFLDQLIESINGFIILDIHNIYCQIHNFNLEFDDIIDLYPLHRVREIHISGGSWEDSRMKPEKKIRRDTHDHSVPEEVFQLLEYTISKCVNLKYVVLEQLGTGLDTLESRGLFQQDFLRLNTIVQHENNKLVEKRTNTFLPVTPFSPGPPVEDKLLHAQQLELSAILETAITCERAKQLLHSSVLANTDWEVEKWEDCMLETAISIAQKWKNSFN
jgi:uncharacterized protein (UPF0276 family)